VAPGGLGRREHREDSADAAVSQLDERRRHCPDRKLPEIPNGRLLIDLPSSLSGYLVNALEELRTLLRNNAIPMPIELEDLQRMLRLRVRTGQDGSTVDEFSSALHDLVRGQRTPKLLTDLAGAADTLDVSESTVTRLVRDKRLRAVHVGKLLKFRRSDLQAYADGLE
jgi:excisionase family DNA binding protein